MLYVIGPKDKNVKVNGITINTTSSSTNWSKGLSPFVLGPITDCNGNICNKFENLWQYNKVYKCHLDSHEEPNNQWIKWRNKGYEDIWANRYPMGKGIKPEYHYWNQQKLDIIEARKHIYIPNYKRLVTQTDAFRQLVALNNKCLEDKQDLVLFDYDGYKHLDLGMSLQDIINNPNKSLGHAFVLYGLLTGEL